MHPFFPKLAQKRQHAALVLTWALTCPALAFAAGAPNHIQDVKVEGTDSERTVRIVTEREPTFTVFRLDDPMRVVIDVSGGDISALHGPLVFEDGVIGQVALRQFNADNFLIGRVIVGFEQERGYDVRAEGRSVVLHSTRLGDAKVATASPPAIGPADRAAAEQAKHERELAEKATREAQTKVEEADRVAKAASALADKAEKAQREAQLARKEAEKSATANRAQAEAAAQEAENRRKKLAAEAQEVAAARAESARVAHEAQAARDAALAKAQQAATLLEGVQAESAKLQRDKEQAEKRAADAVQALAQAHAKEAQQDPTENTTVDAEAASDPTSPSASVAVSLSKGAVSSPAPAQSSRVAQLLAVKTVSKGHDILLRMNARVSFGVERLDNPPRLVLDLKDVKRKLKGYTIGLNTPWAKRVRLGDQGNGVRAVFDLKNVDAQHDVKSVPEGILIHLSERAEVAAAPAAPAKQVQAPRQDATPAVSVALSNVRVRRGEGRSARIEIKVRGAADATVDTSNSDAWILQIQGATVPESLQRSLDATAYHAVVKQVSTYQGSVNPDVVTVIANLDNPNNAATSTLRHVGEMLIWEINAAEQNLTVASAAAPTTAGFVAQAESLARSTPTQLAGGKKRINVDVKDADIINVLRLISEETGENIIASDDVKGKVTLKLHDVPADQALDTMLKTKGFDKVRQNNILRIAPAEAIQKERDLELAKKRSQTEVEETLIKMITINYATAAEIVDQVKPMLTPRGSVQVDTRTNTIILQDIASNVDRLVELARRLDKQTPMVLIQARIVEASTSFLRDLGIQWGGSTTQTQLGANRTGLYFPGSVRTSGAADDLTRNQTAGVSVPSNYAVNLPAVLNGQGGGLGFILASADGTNMLNLRLTAMEQSGSGKIISSPEVATLDNKTAKVSQGVDIPISVVSAAGTNTRFIPAALELEVTPHVTNDGTVLLKIKAQKSAPDFTQKGAAGDPTIQRKFAETEVLVRDGDTSVIGGIYQRTTSENVSEVPFLARLPLIGSLFRERRTEDDRSELLVFITPRIVNRDEAIIPGSALLENGPKAVVAKP